MKSITTACKQPLLYQLVLILVVSTQIANAQDRGSLIPGFVQAHQKISDTEGGFLPPLTDFDEFGSSVAEIGDIDDDGVQDIAVGAPGDDAGGSILADRGAVWILFLNQNGTVKGHQKISDADGGFTGIVDVFDLFGFSVAGVGDLDNDGVEDIVVGAIRDDDGGTPPNADVGAVWVLFLNQNGTVKAHQKISATEGGFTGTLDPLDLFGTSVADVGDLDNDGVRDIVVGARTDDDGQDNSGAVWILFLNTDGTVKGHQKISNTAGGFTGTLNQNDRFGISVSGLGDLDGDGVEDIVVGATGIDDGGDDRGGIYILFLNTDGTVKSHQKISQTSGGFTGTLDDNDFSGSSVTNIGDVDGDGIQDLAVGAILDDDGGIDRGAVWVLFLNSNGTVKFHQKISTLAGGLHPLVLDDSDVFGLAASGLGDLDGDGIPDLVVGATGDDDGGAGRGAVYILFLDGTPALPVELVSFEAASDRANVVLTWQTASEENNAGFEIQRGEVTNVDGIAGTEGTDAGVTWEPVGFVEGRGTTGEPQSYTHPIAGLRPGSHLFRLKQIDFDGSFEFSEVVEVAIEVPGQFVMEAPYPNPFNSRASIEFSLAVDQDVRVVLVDPLGRVLRTLFRGTVPANRPQTVNVNGTALPNGVYAIRLEGATFSEARALIVQR